MLQIPDGPRYGAAMNFLGPQAREAKIRFLDADYQVLREGDYVRCAITGNPIRLENLRYWSVPRQEPYASAEVAFGELLKRLRCDG
jgi:hypothetical protein